MVGTRTRPKLIKIWQDFQPVLFFKSGNREYMRTPQLPADYFKYSGKQLEKLLWEVVQFYQANYPTHNYQGKIVRVKGKRFFIIRRGNIKTWKKAEDIPLYIDLETGDWYIPEWYVRRNTKLASHVVGYRISAIERIIRRHLGMPETTRTRTKPEKKEKQKKSIAVICPKCGHPGFLKKRKIIKKDKATGEPVEYEYWYVGHKKKYSWGWSTQWHYLGIDLPESIKKQLKGGIE